MKETVLVIINLGQKGIWVKIEKSFKKKQSKQNKTQIYHRITYFRR